MLQVVEKLEITVNEYNIKIGELNRTVQDMTSSKQKLQMEATEVKIVDDYLVDRWIDI